MREDPGLNELGRWYHDFSLLGVKVEQYGRPLYATVEDQFFQQQKAKERVVFPWIEYALSRATKNKNVLETFCNDGYYADCAQDMGAEKIVGVDIDAMAIIQAAAMHEFLFPDKPAMFFCHDIRTIDLKDEFSIILCLGGLHHVLSPVELLAKLQGFKPEFLIMQTVVSSFSREPKIFSPSPYVATGSYFTAGYIVNALKETGFSILEERQGIVPGIDDPYSRSFFCFCSAK